MSAGSHRNRRRLRGALLAGLGVLVALAPALAFIPEAAPIARAAAKGNRVARRAQTLELDVTVRRAGVEEPLARGTLLASPDSRARLRLRHRRGFEERQLRRSGGLSGARDGVLLDRPHPLLPPFWVWQARTGSRLLAELGELGGDPGRVAMGYDGAHDCYVLGGRPGVSFWVDQDDLVVVRIDAAGGVTYRVGPTMGPDKGVRVPAWIEVEAPGLPPTRLEVTGARPVTPDAGAFAPAWLERRSG